MAAVSSNPPPNPSKKPCKEPYPPILSNINAKIRWIVIERE